MHRPETALKSAFIVVSLRWTDRLIGFASTLILARLLAPEDFGLIAMASIAIGFAEALLNVGVNVYLVQSSNPTSDHYNTGWTLRVIQGFLLFSLLSLVSPYLADYYDEHRLQWVLPALAFSGFVASFENIGVVNFQRNMNFAAEFRYLFVRRLFGFFVTIALAFWLRNYLALVVGTILMRFFGVALSFFLHPMRPRLSLVKTSEMLKVSFYLMLNNIFSYVDGSLHKVILGGGTNTASMGGYSLACELAELPTSEILSPLNRVLFPLLTRSRGDPLEQIRVVNLAQAVHLTIVLPIAIGFSLLAMDVVWILLGDKWIFIVDSLRVVALFSVVSAILSAPNYLLMANGYFRTVMWPPLCQVIGFIAVLWYLNWSVTLEIVAWVRLGCLFLGMVVGYFLFMRYTAGVLLSHLFRNAVRPLVSSSVMAVFIWFLAANYLADIGVILRLFVSVFLGAFVYLVCLISFWVLQGKPFGPEGYFFNRIGRHFRLLK